MTFKVLIVEIPFQFSPKPGKGSKASMSSSQQSHDEVSHVSRVPESLEGDKEDLEKKVITSKGTGESKKEEVKDLGGNKETRERPIKLNCKNGKDMREEKDLHWDFLVDMNKSKELINSGDTEILTGSSQNSLCNLMEGIKLKGVGRAKRRMTNKKPFEIGK